MLYGIGAVVYQISTSTKGVLNADLSSTGPHVRTPDTPSSTR